MNDNMRQEFEAAFREKFGFGRLTASANADAHQMLKAAEWAWQASGDQLRAEVAGLRTGYEAYERVNAELKAEVARSTEREILQLAEIEALSKDAAPLAPVNGDQLPAINSKVLIHLSSCDAWAEHTVAGYYVWEDLGANEYLHRVFIRVRDADGYLNARLLKDVRTDAAMGQGEPS